MGFKIFRTTPVISSNKVKNYDKGSSKNYNPVPILVKRNSYMKRPNEWDWDNKTAQSSTINNLGFGEDAMRHQARNEPKLRNNNSEPVINMNFGGDEIAQMKYKQTFDNVNQKFSRDGYVRPQTSSNQPDKQIYS